MSFTDRSLCFLHGMCPSWTCLLALRPPQTSEQNYVPQSRRSHGAFWAEFFLPVYKHTLEVSQCYSAAMQLGNQLVTKVNHLLVVSQQNHVSSQLTFKSDIMWLTTGYKCVQLLCEQCKSGMKKLTLLYSLDVQHQLELWYCEHPVPQAQYKNITEFTSSLSEPKKSHFTHLCHLGFHGRFWGHLSFAQASSALQGWPHGSFSEYILLGQVNSCTIPSQKMSFADRSLCFLHGMCPSWTCLLALRPPQTSEQNYVPQSRRSHGAFWAEFFLPVYKHTLEVSQCYSAAMQLGNQLVTKVNHLLVVSQQNHVSSQLTFKSDIMWLTTGYRCVQLLCEQCKSGMISGSVYLSTEGPTLGTKLLLQVFLSFLKGED